MLELQFLFLMLKGYWFPQGHLDFFCISRIPHFHYVAARHELDFCVGLKMESPSLIKTMFPLRALYLGCLYDRLGECSSEAVGTIVGEVLGKR